jgi:hypothetical protein
LTTPKGLLAARRAAVSLALALAACGQVVRNDVPRASAGAAAGGGARAEVGGSGGRVLEGFGGSTLGGGATGGASTAGGALAGVAGESVRPSRALCENAFVDVLELTPDTQRGFEGTFDGAAATLSDSNEANAELTFHVLRFGTHLEAISMGFVIEGGPYNGSVQMSVVTCRLEGSLFRKDDAGLASFPVEKGSLLTVTETADWQTGSTRGTLHAEFVNEDGTERHVLDGKLTLLAVLPDARMSP